MALVVRSGRRRRWAVMAAAAAALVGLGYCSYSLYTSEAWRRRRQQMARLLNVLSLLGDAAQEGAESAALISSDFKRFLLSDEDELPRSLRQILKIAHSFDLQHSCTVLTAALTRGLIRGFASYPPPPFPSTNRNRSNAPPEDLSCKEIKEICLVSCSDASGSHKGGVQCIEESNHNRQEWELQSSKRAGSTLDIDGRRQQRGSKQPEELPDRLLGKLFSEPGVNFASAVMGNVACNIVKALFDGFESQNVSQISVDKPNSSGNGTEEKAVESKVVNLLCTQQCRGLIAECIQTLVSTAVSVYIEKTKDINFYDDMVAGITNPSHKDPMKDLLTTVCSGAVETLVKTSHNVIFAKKSGPQGSGVMQHYSEHGQWTVEELMEKPQAQSQLSVYNPSLSISQSVLCQGRIDGLDAQVCTSSSNVETCNVSVPMIPKQSMEGILQSSELKGEKPQKDNGVQSFIDGVSKTLAIPSNHKLVVDVAGTMTSEAVRSFVNVIISTISSNLRRAKFGKDDGENCALQHQTRCKETVIKTFVLASICLAICLHMLTGVHMMERS